MPDSIFQPLTGANRRAHAAVLDRLHRCVFGAETDGVPIKREVLTEIEEAIRDLGVLVEREDGDIDPPGNESGLAHYWVYYRLKATGWLVEQRDRWESLVEMPPAALALLDALTRSARARAAASGPASLR